MITGLEAIKDVMKSSDKIYSVKEVAGLVEKKFPNRWKKRTILNYLNGCTVNSATKDFFPKFPKFLYLVDPGEVKLYDPETDGDFSSESTNSPEPLVEHPPL